MRIGSKLPAIGLFLGVIACGIPASAQYTANSLAELRNYATTLNNATITLSDTGGDPHPVSGAVRPGIYWINGDHIANPTSTTPIFLDLAGNGNTFDFTGTSLKLDTRKLDGFGRALGHESGVRVVRLSGSNNTVNGLTLVGEDVALDIDPNAQRWADWAATYFRLSGDNNRVENTFVESRGSSPYGVSDAFGKGARQFPQGEPPGQVPGEPEGVVGLPWVGHNKTSAFLVRDATNAVVDNLELQVRSYGHGFFVQQATNTTLTNSTIKGELVPATNVINHEKYQEYGFTSQGTEIPEDIMISANEDGVRAYGPIDGVPVLGLTVENVVVTNMRQGFAVSVAQTDLDNGLGVNLNRVEAYGNEVGFTPGTHNSITNAKGDITNGPLVWFQYNNTRDTTVEVEVVGDVPVGEDYAAAYLNGQRLDVTIDSDLPLGHLPEDSLVRLGQTYFNNWRDSSIPTGPEDSDPGDFIDSVFTNNTNQMLVLGNLATNNTGSSQAAIVPNGKDNAYDGISIVLADMHVVVTDTLGLGNNGSSADGTLETNASVVADGGTLELAAGIQINNEKLTITGDGVDGNGALYAAGSGSRFGTSSNSNESTIFLDGDASIGVDGDLIVGRIQGAGNLTKRGSGKLSLEKSNTFVGDLIVAEGEVSVRPNGVNHGLMVSLGATISTQGDYAYNTDGHAEINGTLDLNGRTNETTLTQRIGSLSGLGSIVSSNTQGTAASVLEISGDDVEATYQGLMTGDVSLVKSGTGAQSLTPLLGSLDYNGTTTVNEGRLLVNGFHSGGGDFQVNNGGTLGGAGAILSATTVASGGVLAPGASAGSLAVREAELSVGSTLEIEIGGTTGGSEYDLFSTTQGLTLAGDLVVSLLDNGGELFIPDSTDIFTIISSGSSINGLFANAAAGQRIESLGGEGSFLVNYDAGANSVFLTDFLLAGLTGDYNQDGVVDAADYAVWRETLGSTSDLRANGDNTGASEGIIDSADFNVWMDSYGADQLNAATARVPEPAALLLQLGACVFMHFMVGHREQRLRNRPSTSEA